MNYTALVIATGKNTAMNQGYRKVFGSLKEGLTVLDQSLAPFIADDRCRQIVIVTNRVDMAKIVSGHGDSRILSVMGGKSRQESVYNGLMAAMEDLVLIHEATRPWLSLESIDRLLAVMTENEAACLAVRLQSSIKHVNDGYVDYTLSHEDYVVAQTPQAFKTSVVLMAYHKALQSKTEFLDDSEAVAAMSQVRVRVVQDIINNARIQSELLREVG